MTEPNDPVSAATANPPHTNSPQTNLPSSTPAVSTANRSNKFGDWVRKFASYIITLVLVAFAVLLITEVWYLYMRAPWTRDAFVRVEVTDIAPEGISGYVTKIPVKINDRVMKGDLLFEIDPTRYELALAQANANFKAAQTQAALDSSFAESRVRAGRAVSEEDRQTYITRAETSRLQMVSAEAALGLAQYNLYRTKIFAPSDGFIANLTLRVGDYVSSGQSAMVLLNEDSFWVEAYFQETKIAGIKPGDKAVIALMAHEQALQAEVVSLSRGIANANNNPGYLGLQQINPIDSWVRLAQRIPVYIKIKELPDGVPLVAGMTASVAVGETAQETLNPLNLFDRLVRWLTFYL
jgi:multidrug resistance efflux pump